jgi:hypothetical protein
MTGPFNHNQSREHFPFTRDKRITRYFLSTGHHKQRMGLAMALVLLALVLLNEHYHVESSLLWKGYVNENYCGY